MNESINHFFTSQILDERAQQLKNEVTFHPDAEIDSQGLLWHQYNGVQIMQEAEYITNSMYIIYKF